MRPTRPARKSKKIIVAADAVSRRAGNVDIPQHSCDLAEIEQQAGAGARCALDPPK